MTGRMQLFRGVMPDRAALTRREQTVLEHVLKGMTASQIARQLQLAPRIVERHIEKIYDKLGAGIPAHLVIQAKAGGKPESGK